jgi:hypothetical protein
MPQLLRQANHLSDVRKDCETSGSVPTPYFLTYVDDEGENITISHEREFQDAADFFKVQQTPFKLIVNSRTQNVWPAAGDSAPNGSTLVQAALETKEAVAAEQQAISPMIVQAKSNTVPTSPSADSVSALYQLLQRMPGWNQKPMSIQFQEEGELRFRCRVVLNFGRNWDGEYAWSQAHGNKKAAKQDAARIALESLTATVIRDTTQSR